MGLLGNCSACERPIHENACVTYLCTDGSGREYTENYHFECKPYISPEYPWVMEFAYDVGEPGGDKAEWHFLDAHDMCANAKVVLKSGTLTHWATDMSHRVGLETSSHKVITVRIRDVRKSEAGDVVAARAFDSVGCCQSTHVAEDYRTLWDMS